jgi:hypothetical protein
VHRKFLFSLTRSGLVIDHAPLLEQYSTMPPPAFRHEGFPFTRGFPSSISYRPFKLDGFPSAVFIPDTLKTVGIPEAAAAAGEEEEVEAEDPSL